NRHSLGVSPNYRPKCRSLVFTLARSMIPVVIQQLKWISPPRKVSSARQYRA
uniref:Phosphopyruvate hydratase n=1 Tax=Parascaris univalens TaxID=6257 RepID=A0A915B1K1_PARUN